MSTNHKTASATLYIQEELSDARLRCDELKHAIMQAIDFINASDQRDHFYSVAGNLILSIPETLMKLDKALDASALAVNRIDTEELKLSLRPQKVEELERVLEDIRLKMPRRLGEMPRHR